MLRRWMVISVMSLSGCGMWQRRPVQTTYIPPHEIRSKLVHDRDRLLGYDSPRHLADTFFGVDATGLGLVAAVRHVIVSSIYHVYQQVNGDTPLKFAKEMESKNPDREREGILKLANYRFVRMNPIYAKRWDLIANDRAADPTVRAAAIRAMNHSRDHAHKQTFVEAMDDADYAVRLEAAKALANVPDEKAVPQLIAHLQKDDDKDVRIACADALREYKTAEVARALVSVLPDRDFGIAFRARESLLLMTGRNFRFDEARWLDYFAKTEKPFI